MNKIKIKNNKKIMTAIVVSLVLCLWGFYQFVGNAKAAQREDYSSFHNIGNSGRSWAWTLDGAWMSTNKTGKWETDNWFYLLKPGEPVVVVKIDSELGYYLVSYDFDSQDGWLPIVGWVRKENILLQSQITPSP